MLTRPHRIACASAIAVALSSCATERSTEAFCSTLEREVDRQQEAAQVWVDQMEAANDPFASISIAMAATLEQQGLQVIMLKELESVAPEEILTDVELLREMSEAQLDNTAASATDPMGAVLSGFASFGQSLGPARTVGAFTDANCSIDVFS